MRKKQNNDEYILKELNRLQDKLIMAQESLNHTTDEALIDSLIYEVLSLNKKYEYFLKLCKEKGLIAKGFPKIS